MLTVFNGEGVWALSYTTRPSTARPVHVLVPPAGRSRMGGIEALATCARPRGQSEAVHDHRRLDAESRVVRVARGRPPNRSTPPRQCKGGVQTEIKLWSHVSV